MPTLLLGAPRKLVKTENPNGKQEVGLQGEISRTLEEDEQKKKLFYLKKSRLGTGKAETKRIILGLEPFMGRRDIVYSLNMLMLYSVNNHHPFLFENHEKIFTALSSFAQSLYPPRFPQDK